jgi:hypothetical protein
MAVQVTAGATHRPDLWRYSWDAWRDQERTILLGHYAEAALPSKTVVLGFIHTGSIAFYSRLRTIRLDLVDASQLESLVDALVAHGFEPVILLDDEIELGAFRTKFAGSRFGRLDWNPRARFVGAGQVTLWYALDAGAMRRSAFTDVLRVSARN